MYAKMKLKDAIQIIEERERKMRIAQKEMKKVSISFSRIDNSNGKEYGMQNGTNGMRSQLVHVQSIFPYPDVLALKEKAGETTIRDAISKAVHHYLSCKDDDDC